MRCTRARRPPTGSTTSSPTPMLARGDGAGEPAEILAGAHAPSAPGSGRRRRTARCRAAALRRGARAAAGRRTRACAASAARRCRPAPPRPGSPPHPRSRSGRASARNSASISRKRASRPADQVHLVDGQHDAAHAHQVEDGGMPPRLLLDAAARIDQQDRHIGVRGAGRHVARVLLVARAVDDDEPARRAYRSSARRCRW